MKIKIGVMASAEVEAAARLKLVIEELGAEIARRDWLLLTGATTGMPDALSREARRRGCLTIGISPAHNASEHTEVYRLPVDGCDALIFTGFGLKGRNVVLVRSCDIVLIVAGGTGTLNEFTIAADEGKVIGALRGTGGITDEIERLLPHVRRPENVLIEPSPVKLFDLCLARYQALHFSGKPE
jgi:uncharacterized protein (TIGR00725 family)